MDIIVYGVLGAFWRRWLGSAILTPRWLELTIGGAIAGAIGWQFSSTLAIVLFTVTAIGWSFGHSWNKPWRMMTRYGLFTLSLSIGILVVTSSPWSIMVLPFGMIAPLLYSVPRRLGITQYTVAGELSLGASVYSGLAVTVGMV